MEKYKILRPPLNSNFELPTREELLALKVGDTVKLIFEVSNADAERMWIILTDITNPQSWEGLLDNDPFSPEMSDAIKAGDKVRFHPLDIISIYE